MRFCPKCRAELYPGDEYCSQCGTNLMQEQRTSQPTHAPASNISSIITCPMCGATGSDLEAVEDKRRVITYVGHIPLYGKKHICKKCQYEF